MKTRVLLVLLCTACASACARSRAPVGAEGAFSAALREGPREVALNGVRHFYRVAGTAPAGVPPVVFLHDGPGQGSEHLPIWYCGVRSGPL